MLAYARFHGRDVLTVDVCKEALGPAFGVQRPDHGREDPEDGCRFLQDQGGRHKLENAGRPISPLPRQVAMYLAKELTQKSLPEIGDLFGGRDHTTVLHAVRKISDARAKQAELNHTLHVLEQTLKG